jgi:quercetin dioxygenase-like cupin family protein
MYSIAFAEFPWESAPSGVRFKVHKEEGRQLRLLEFGQDLAHSHWCTIGHIGYVIAGELEIEFDNEVIIFRAGDGVTIPSGQKDRHRPRAVTELVRLIFIEEV